MINKKTPGLITKWRAPFEEKEKSKKQHGKMSLTIINPTEKRFRLPSTVKITNDQKVRFIKERGTDNSEALLVLGPESLNTIPALNKEGKEIQVRRITAAEVERDILQKAETTYANYVIGENLLLEAFPNEEHREDFPADDPNRIPDTVREYQGETNRQEEHSTEFMEYPNIKTNGPIITLKEYSLMGELPISDKSGVIIITMAHLLASVGCSMQLAYCKRRILQLILNKYSQKEIVTMNKQLQLDYRKNRVLEIYKVWPRTLALKAHVYCLDASVNLRRINLTKSSSRATQKLSNQKGSNNVDKMKNAGVRSRQADGRDCPLKLMLRACKSLKILGI